MAQWTDTLSHGRPLDSLGMKCGMDRDDTLTIDLHGSVITCQNVSVTAVVSNGQSHHGGSLDDPGTVRIKTATHVLDREHCRHCPVVQVCRGGCMYLIGALFRASSENTYTDQIPYFAAAVEALTGLLPYHIEDEADTLPASRRDILGHGRSVGHPA